jgi:hypothetical protein
MNDLDVALEPAMSVIEHLRRHVEDRSLPAKEIGRLFNLRRRELAHLLRDQMLYGNTGWYTHWASNNAKLWRYAKLKYRKTELAGSSPLLVPMEEYNYE